MTEDSTEKPQVMVVDDSKVIRRAAIKMLSDDYQVHEAVDGKDGWQQLLRNDAISVVFTDMQMPEMNGIELLANIRGSDDERLAALPVIMITGIDDTDDAKRMVYESGATDFITKPFQSIDLLSRARSYASLNRKVTELEKDTSHDSLTGLYSVASYKEQGEKALAFALRHEVPMSTVFFEIEHIDDIYITHGKKVAQQIVVAVAKRLQAELRTEDIAARLGAAKYGALLPSTDGADACVVISRICDSINKLMFSTGQDRVSISLAAGYTTVEIGQQLDFLALITQADAALQMAMADNNGNKVIAFLEKERNQAAAISNEDMAKAVQHILQGAYKRVPDNMLQAVADKLIPFLDYVANRSDTEMTGTDDS